MISSLVMGTVFTGVDTLGGAPFTAQSVGRYIGAIYVYNILQCPLEAIHGRESLWHNMIASGTIGYVGVTRGLLGIPFVDVYTFYRYPQLRPGLVAFGVYGAMGGVFGALGGKRL